MNIGFCQLYNYDVIQDETAIIWYVKMKEKQLRLSNVSKIIAGQRTVSTLLCYSFCGKMYSSRLASVTLERCIKFRFCLLLFSLIAKDALFPSGKKECLQEASLHVSAHIVLHTHSLLRDIKSVCWS